MRRWAGTEAQCLPNQNPWCTVGERPNKQNQQIWRWPRRGGQVGRARAGSEASFFSQPLNHLLGGGHGLTATFWPLPMLPSMQSLRGPPPSCMPLARGASTSAFRGWERKDARSLRRRNRPAAILPKLSKAGTSAEGTSACGKATPAHL